MIFNYVLNCILFIVIGIAEGYLWHYSVNKITKQQAKNLHLPLMALRVIWYVWLLIHTRLDYSSVICLYLCHPFFHLGMMYQTRNMLNPKIYIYKFFDTASNTSTSIADTLFPMPFFIRLVMFIFGSVWYFIWNTF